MFKIYMYTSVLPACMYVLHVHGWHLCLEEGIGASVTGVAISHHMGAGNELGSSGTISAPNN